jgi:hypothetical protein
MFRCSISSRGLRMFLQKRNISTTGLRMFLQKRNISTTGLRMFLQKRNISTNRDFYIQKGKFLYLIDTSIHHSKYNNSVSLYKSLEHYYDILKKDKIGLKIEYETEYIDIVKKILKLREIVQEYQLEASDHYISVDGKLKFISKEQDLYRQHTHEYVIQLYRNALCLPYKKFTYQKHNFSLKPKPL